MKFAGLLCCLILGLSHSRLSRQIGNRVLNLGCTPASKFIIMLVIIMVRGGCSRNQKIEARDGRFSPRFISLELGTTRLYCHPLLRMSPWAYIQICIHIPKLLLSRSSRVGSGLCSQPFGWCGWVRFGSFKLDDDQGGRRVFRDWMGHPRLQQQKALEMDCR
jgi:hypothetical protein